MYFRFLKSADTVELVNPLLDEASEVDEGLQDVEEALSREGNPRSGAYWPRIRATLLKESSSQDVYEALKEWDGDGSAYIGHESCQLCGKNPIKFCYPIFNKVTHSRLVVGCECIFNYLEIRGYENPKVLKKRLTAQKTLLKKKEKGEISEGQEAFINQALDLEEQIRRRVGAISREDFDVNEYHASIKEACTVCVTLRLTDPAITAAQSALTASSILLRFMETVRKTQKFTGYGLSTLTSKVVAKRDPEVRVSLLNSLSEKVDALFKLGTPNEVISRVWAVVETAKDKILADVESKCSNAKRLLAEKYQNEISVVKPYSYLNFLLGQGIKAIQTAFEAQLNLARTTLEDPKFFENMKTSAGAISKIMSYNFSPDLVSFEGEAEKKARQVIDFIADVSRNPDAIVPVNMALRDIYNLPSIARDIPGIKVSLFRAADDESVLDVDELGVRSVYRFVRLLRGKDPKILAIVEKEVDDIAKLVKDTGNQLVHQRMSEELGFDVERVFKLYASTNDFESSFCTSIFEQWSSGRLTELSPARMGNIQKTLTYRGRQKEIPNSMWEKFKARLTAKARSNF